MTFFEKAGIDAVTFEVLSHRLFSINDEAAATLKVVSGSPVSNEAHDFNTGLLDAEGEVVVCGIYIAGHAITLKSVAEFILKEYQENPGIGPNDMFICNDPYIGSLHQNDVVCIAPIFWKDELVAWSGVAVHQMDVGGPTKGSQCSIGADSIFQEAPVMPPLKIMENGIVRKDIKYEYLRRSRLPHLLELDLRAKIAANHRAKLRVKELIEQYGVKIVKDTMKAIVNYTELRFRERLKELPDGVWRHVSYLEYEGKTYGLKVSVGKKRDKLIFDFTGTAGQAPAVINCTLPVLQGVISAPLRVLGYDFPLCPAGVMRAVEIIAEPGTLVNATWPAGVSKSTTGAATAAKDAVTGCLFKMLASSDKYHYRAMAGVAGSSGTQEIFGNDEEGRPFGGVILDSLVNGGGATPFEDGVDTSGIMGSIACSKVNVETYEFRYPVLYIFSRQERDSGGAGKFRGGTSYSCLYMPHGVAEIPWSLFLRLTPDSSGGAGVLGGYPGSGTAFAIKRNSNILELFRKGIIPEEFDEVSGDTEGIPPFRVTCLNKTDVWLRQNSGGGGYGDPLEREPQSVIRDVMNGLVSLEAALDLYGVVIEEKDLRIDFEATGQRRQQIINERKESFCRK